MVTYTGILRVITVGEDIERETIDCDSFAEACIAIGELRTLYIGETIYEIGVIKTELVNGKRTMEYTIINKMNEQTEKTSRDWVKRDCNYLKIANDIKSNWVKLHNIHETCSDYLYGGKPITL